MPTRVRVVAACAAVVVVLGAVGVALATGGSSPRHATTSSRHATTSPRHVATAQLRLVTAPPPAPKPAAPTTPAATAAPAKRRPVATTVRLLSLRITDPHRRLPGGAHRSFLTLVRVPVGPRGPFPLIVFGHGYAVTPAPYSPLLDAWARAGYVVAAPVFPLENAGAPGGPNENDLPNQPRDMSLVIDRVLSGGAGRLVRRHRIAVSGQSDGGDTALAAAFDPRVRDPRVAAAVILSGAFDPFISRFAMPTVHVPLLATQGTADDVNPPWMTHQFYDPATPPKFLLTLRGQGHLQPYTEPGITFNTVVRATTAFLNCYLKGGCARWDHFRALRTAGTPSTLTGS